MSTLWMLQVRWRRYGLAEAGGGCPGCWHAVSLTAARQCRCGCRRRTGGATPRCGRRHARGEPRGLAPAFSGSCAQAASCPCHSASATAGGRRAHPAVRPGRAREQAELPKRQRQAVRLRSGPTHPPHNEQSAGCPGAASPARCLSAVFMPLHRHALSDPPWQSARPYVSS